MVGSVNQVTNAFVLPLLLGATRISKIPLDLTFPPFSLQKIDSPFAPKAADRVIRFFDLTRDLFTKAIPLVKNPQDFFPLTAKTKPDDTFAKRAVTASNPVIVSGKAADDAPLVTRTITVSQLAAAQRNQGTSLPTTGVTTIAPGTNQVGIQVGQDFFTVSFQVAPGDTNLTALASFAAAINGAAIGLQAAVVTGSSSGTSAISIAAAATGTARAFTLGDLVGNAAATTGANTMVTAPLDASFTIDSFPQTSQTNTFTLDQGKLTLSFLALSSNPVTVTTSLDTTNTVTRVEEFVQAHNNLVSFLSSLTAILPITIETFTETSLAFLDQQRARDLAAAGITVDQKSGLLSLDKPTLTPFLQQNAAQAQDLLGGKEGLAQGAAILTSVLLETPPSLFGVLARSFTDDPEFFQRFLDRLNGLLVDQQA